MVEETIKILYVDNIEKLDYEYLPTYKKCSNGKYLQICSTKLNEDILKENADPTDLVSALDGFAQPVFNALSKKMNVNFVEDKEEKVLIIRKYVKYQNYEFESR